MPGDLSSHESISVRFQYDLDAQEIQRPAPRPASSRNTLPRPPPIHRLTHSHTPDDAGGDMGERGERGERGETGVRSRLPLKISIDSRFVISAVSSPIRTIDRANVLARSVASQNALDRPKSDTVSPILKHEREFSTHAGKALVGPRLLHRRPPAPLFFVFFSLLVSFFFSFF